MLLLSIHRTWDGRWKGWGDAGALVVVCTIMAVLHRNLIGGPAG